MDRIVCDIECTVSNKGNVFDTTNKLVVVGIRNIDTNKTELFYYPNKEEKEKIQKILDNSLFIAFNAKFDLHWLRRIGIDISNIRVWDTQLGEFLLNNQKTPYPSLDQAAEKYDLQKKLDIVKLNYWEKGIDTDQIPREILSSYLEQDLILTEQVYLKQVEQFKDNGKLSLFKLQCRDLLVLAEMEANGIVFDTEKALKKAKELDEKLTEIYKEMSALVGNVPFNLSSHDHLSAILYGGIISEDVRVPIGTYKTGSKEGQTRYKVVVKEYELSRLVEPLEGTEIKKPEGGSKVWKTNEEVLKKVKLYGKAKKIVELINEQSKMEKLKGTYLEGYSKLIDKMNWEKDILHGTLNQCVTVTGRLSSASPNLQNADPETKRYMVSRYDCQL